VAHLNNFNMPFDSASEILIFNCELYEIRPDKMHILLTELQSNQKCASKMFTDKEMRIWSLQKRSKRLKKFGCNDMILIIGMIIKYVDKDRTLLNILLLSGEVHDTIKDEALK